MSYPPGYDDESVVPQSRLSTLLHNLERELEKVEKVYSEALPGEIEKSAVELPSALGELRITGSELSSEYAFLIEKLIRDYEHFSEAPDRAKLEQLFSDIKSLQLLLIG